MFAGWTRWYHWCIAVNFRFLASEALHRTMYRAEHFSFLQFQPWMFIILTRTQLVLLSISIVFRRLLCKRGTGYLCAVVHPIPSNSLYSSREASKSPRVLP